MSYEQKLFDATVNLIEQRFGKTSDEGAAAVYTKSGKIITSTSPDTLNDSVTLCHETGAYCEAYKLDDPIVASICVHQGEDGKNLVFTPCGVCQERLFLYGDDVMVGVPDDTNANGYSFKKLSDVQPYHWRKAIKE